MCQYKESNVALMGRGGNRARQVGFGFGSSGSGQFDLLEEIGSGRVNLHDVFSYL
jgi:hypothetical protein